jgi:hypothetical protein
MRAHQIMTRPVYSVSSEVTIAEAANIMLQRHIGSLNSAPRPWHSRAGGGAVHSIRFGPMHRSKQLKLFDHLVGAGEQKMRDCDLAELAPWKE